MENLFYLQFEQISLKIDILRGFLFLYTFINTLISYYIFYNLMALTCISFCYIDHVLFIKRFLTCAKHWWFYMYYHINFHSMFIFTRCFNMWS